MQKVKENGRDSYYCQAHYVEYDEAYYATSWEFTRPSPVYYKRVQVDIDGVPIGYKPKK